MTSRHLKLSAAIAALALGAASPAFAFDQTNWTWTLTRTDNITHDVTSSLSASPTGDAAIQARQIYLGDVTADSDSSAFVIPPSGAAMPLDASTEAGHVDSRASAYANVYTAAAETPLAVNLGQYHLGGVDTASMATPTIPDPTAMNANFAYANALIADSQSGLFTPHNVTANASATDIQDATASSEARAVSNTASFEVVAPPAELVGVDPSGGYVTNAILGADLTQLSIGDGHSNAVTSVRFEMTGNLGSLDRPLASASATTIGNLGSAVVRTGSFDILN